jgi:hypothetical protein
MESSSQTTAQPAYPVRFSVEYPDRALNRLTTAFRLIVAIPILIVAATLGGQDGTYAAGEQGWRIAGGTAGLLFLGPLLMILFRQKYPRWWLDWNRELLRFSNRIGVYLALMDDRYPSTDEQQGSRSISPTRTRGRDSIDGCRWSSGCSRSPITSCSSSSGSPPWCLWSSPGSRSFSLGVTHATSSTSSSESSAGRTALSATR